MFKRLIENPSAIRFVWLQAVVLFKEAIKPSFFGLLEYLEHQHLWNWFWSKNGQKERTFFKNATAYYSCKKLRLFHARNGQETEDIWQRCTSHPNGLTRIQREGGGLSAQLCRWIRTSQSLVLEPDDSQVLSWQLYSIVPLKHQSHQQQWRDSGVLAFFGRVWKKKPYLRLANEKPYLRLANEKPYLRLANENPYLRLANENPYLRLANERNKLKWAKGRRWLKICYTQTSLR